MTDPVIEAVIGTESMFRYPRSAQERTAFSVGAMWIRSDDERSFALLEARIRELTTENDSLREGIQTVTDPMIDRFIAVVTERSYEPDPETEEGQRAEVRLYLEAALHRPKGLEPHELPNPADIFGDRSLYWRGSRYSAGSWGWRGPGYDEGWEDVDMTPQQWRDLAAIANAEAARIEANHG